MRRDSLRSPRSLRGGLLAVVGGWLVLTGCATETGPEVAALEYARALYASDLTQAYRLISSEDQGVKDEESFRKEKGGPTGFALEVAHQLASLIEATPVEKTISAQRARVRLKLTLPNANAPEIAALVHDWDEQRLNALPQTERSQIMRKLDQLRQAGRIPMLKGEETFEVVREASGWRVFLNWAGGVRVRFGAVMLEAIPLQATFSQEELLLTAGERAHVTVRLKNLSHRDIVTRVGHRVEPRPHADFLALLQCPLFLPVTLKSGDTAEFVSVYTVLKDAPPEAKQFQVTYEFRSETKDGGVRRTPR
jgi:hypothetical protein